MVKEYYKKIDKSFFDGRITVPEAYIDLFTDKTEMQKEKSKGITVIFKRKKYKGKYRFVHQSTGRLVLQITYSADLCKKLKQEFIQTFFAIKSQKLLERKKKFQTNLLGGNQEIAVVKVKENDVVEIVPYVKIQTQYDNIFKRLVELNVFGWMSKDNKSDQFITKNSAWYDIKDLPKHADTPYVIYYLIDETKKHIYIGSAQRLGDRVKPKRKEIPNWNKFMYEVVHPSFHGYLRELEYHSIMNFARFFENSGGLSSAQISEYKLVNKDYKFYRK